VLAGILYALATGADITSTVIALHIGLHEGNPVVGPLIQRYGILPQVAVSAGLCSILYWYAVRGGSKLVYALAFLRWLVVANNLGQLLVSAILLAHT
jgi:hypothetical protein